MVIFFSIDTSNDSCAHFSCSSVRFLLQPCFRLDHVETMKNKKADKAFQIIFGVSCCMFACESGTQCTKVVKMRDIESNWRCPRISLFASGV